MDEEDSILSLQYSDKELHSARIRKHSIRRLKKLVDKCCIKCIHFPKKFCEISKRLAKDSDLVTDNEIIELRTECFESLSSMGCMSDSNSSSSDSSSEKIPKKRKGLPTPVCLLTLHQNWTQRTLTMLHTVIADIQKRVTMDQLGVLTTMGVIHSFDLDLQVFIIILHHGRTAGIKIPLSCCSNNNSPVTYTLPIQ